MKLPRKRSVNVKQKQRGQLNFRLLYHTHPINTYRQQNQMPQWHLKSTISGDLTALGIQQAAREAAQTHTHILDSLTPTTTKPLDGLPSPSTLISQQQQSVLKGIPPYLDVKPVIDHQSDCKFISSSSNDRLTCF